METVYEGTAVGEGNTGSVVALQVTQTGNYVFTLIGANGTYGSNVNGSTTYEGRGGYAAKVVTKPIALALGDVLHVVLGKPGSNVRSAVSDGAGGGSGGATWVLKVIDSVVDSSIQFQVGNTCYEVLACAAGGCGTQDKSYKKTNYNANSASIKLISKDEFVAAGGRSMNIAASQGSFNGGTYTRNSNTGYGGYGLGIAYDDNASEGGGWSTDSSTGDAGSSGTVYGKPSTSFAQNGGVVTRMDKESQGYCRIDWDYDFHEDDPEGEDSTGEVQRFTVPETGDYTLVLRGAGGSLGSNRKSTVTNGMVYNGKGGKGAVVTTHCNLAAGDTLMIVVGKMGKRITNNIVNDGASGGSGGATWVFRKIASITDSSYQISYGGEYWELLAVAAGGGGTQDQAYRAGRLDGADAYVGQLYSLSNWVASSTTTASVSSSTSVSGPLSLKQIATNGFNGAFYTRNNRSNGGFGCGSATDDNQSYAGGWHSAGSYKTSSFAKNGGSVRLAGDVMGGACFIFLSDGINTNITINGVTKNYSTVDVNSQLLKITVDVSTFRFKVQTSLDEKRPTNSFPTASNIERQMRRTLHVETTEVP